MSKKMIDLSLIKKLVVELETTMTEADRLKAIVEQSLNADSKIECIIQLNKALGLAAGIMTESSMLMGDLQHQMHGGPVDSNKVDFMEKILKGLGPAGGTGNAN